MDTAEVLIDAFDRVRSVVHSAVDGLRPAQLNARPAGGSEQGNSIAWLVWHLARVQDDHIAEVAGRGQAWVSSGWMERFDLPFDATAIGYGHSSQEVDAVQVASGELLTGYYDAVHEQTLRYLKTLSATDLDRIVDDSWDPPVTLGARLVSVISDDLQHAGQASFVRGLLA